VTAIRTPRLHVNATAVLQSTRMLVPVVAELQCPDVPMLDADSPVHELSLKPVKAQPFVWLQDVN